MITLVASKKGEEIRDVLVRDQRVLEREKAANAVTFTTRAYFIQHIHTHVMRTDLATY